MKKHIALVACVVLLSGTARADLFGKAARGGRQLVKVDRWFPSTKTCSCCGTTGHKLSLSDREWTCPDCGTLHDRDRNAAMNLKIAGLARLASGDNVIPRVAPAA